MIYALLVMTGTAVHYILLYPHSERNRLLMVRLTCALALLAALASFPASAQTLNFDTLPSEQGVTTLSPLTTANSGSPTISGITFNAATYSDWEIVGNSYVPYPSFSPNDFAQTNSGTYTLAGNAYSGQDSSGTIYTGLTISTNQILKNLYVGFDDNGGGSNDADSLTVTAFGASGDLAAQSVPLTSTTLALVDTSSVFGSLSGVTGYRFETTAADLVNAGFGRAYVIADDLTFGAPIPEASSALTLGLCLVLGGGILLVRRTRKTAR